MPPVVTERLKKCLDYGGSAALFSILASWPQDELKALLKDADEFYEASRISLDEGYRKTVMTPEAFFNKRNFDQINEAWKQANIEILGVCSEISAVAICFLERGD